MPAEQDGRTSGEPSNLLGAQLRFAQVKYITRGSHGAVARAFDNESQQWVALKFIPRGPKINKYVEREIQNHRRLRHPHVVHLCEVFLTDANLVLVLEYAAGGDLMGRTQGGVSEEEAHWYFRQVLLAVDFMHRMGVASRDIKLENTLVMDESPRPIVKLADFGFSKDENYQSAPGTRVGTPAYLAPEIITNLDGQTYDGKQADVWSCGVMLFTMLTGIYPFYTPEDEQLPFGMKLHRMMQRIVNVNYKFPSWKPLSEGCRDLIAKILVADPQQRLTVQQVLHHPWVAQGQDPSILSSFNDGIVASSLANAPPPEVLDAIKAMCQQAAVVAKNEPEVLHGQGVAMAAAAAQAAAGAGAGGAAAAGGMSGGFDDDYDLDDSTDFDYHPI